jgi:predicted nucleic acid-binding protein
VIVVDTNVISELMRGEPHPAVLTWVAAQPRALLYTTHINQAEILYGIGALPEGGGARRYRQRQRLCSRRILPIVFCRSKRRRPR